MAAFLLLDTLNHFSDEMFPPALCTECPLLARKRATLRFRDLGQGCDPLVMRLPDYRAE